LLDFGFLRDKWLFIVTGISATLGIAVTSFVLSTPVALMVAKGRRASILPVSAASAFYVLVMDGIPLLLQIPLVYFALPQIGIVLPGFWTGVLVLTINYGSRTSKNFYERFAATEKSADEHWISLIPSLTDEFTSMIKDSTLLGMTALIQDVYWRATRTGRAEFRNYEGFIIAAIIYLILITIVSLGSKALSFKMAASNSGRRVAT
jgi:polar amino acid transport system permease protein